MDGAECLGRLWDFCFLKNLILRLNYRFHLFSVAKAGRNFFCPSSANAVRGSQKEDRKIPCSAETTAFWGSREAGRPEDLKGVTGWAGFISYNWCAMSDPPNAIGTAILLNPSPLPMFVVVSMSWNQWSDHILPILLWIHSGWSLSSKRSRFPGVSSTGQNDWLKKQAIRRADSNKASASGGHLDSGLPGFFIGFPP